MDKILGRMRRAAVLAATLVAAATSALAQVSLTDQTRIRPANTGWGGDLLRIEVTSPIVNPAGCATPDGYVVGAQHSWYKVTTAAALTGYTLGRPVRIAVSHTECFAGRPLMLGIHLE